MSNSENSASPPDDVTPEEVTTASATTDSSADDDSSAATESAPRRNFMTQVLAAGIGGLVGLIPAVTGLLFFLDPLLRKKAAGNGDAKTGGVVKDAEGRILLDVSLDALPEDGTPQRYTVHDDIVNAWNKLPNQPIGSIWLRRIDSATPPVIAFSTICPHLGCSVDYRATEGDYYCPCHTSAFKLDGTALNDIPPRAMDELEVKVTGNHIWLKYQEFRGAIQEKVEV